MVASRIYWFRKGGALRLADNRSLVSGLKGVRRLYPVCILSGADLRQRNTSLLFLLETIQELDLRLRNLGSRLFLFRGEPEDVLPRLSRMWRVSQIAFASPSCDPAAQRTCNKVVGALEAIGVRTMSETDHLLDPSRAWKGWTSLDQFVADAHQGSQVERIEPEPCSLPPYDPDLSKLKEIANGNCKLYHRTPTLSELGVRPCNQPDRSMFLGGESQGTARMEMWMASPSSVGFYDASTTDPFALDPASTALSPFLAIGSLSPRMLFQRAANVEESRQDSSAEHPERTSLLTRQLLRREFCHLLATVRNLEQEEVPVAWDTDAGTTELFCRWKNGETGYPLVDAAMRQLRHHGWLHDKLRHVVACFLTRGDLFIDWRHGRQAFQELSLDYDWALCTYWWMHASCVAYNANFRLVPNPKTFGARYDPHGAYVRHFLPVLGRFDRHYIWGPGAAPDSLQRQCNCVVNVDYPAEVVDHDTVARRNAAKMRDALASKPSRPELLTDPQRHRKTVV